jgi:hypothetical protein
MDHLYPDKMGIAGWGLGDVAHFLSQMRDDTTMKAA